jgi:hypothetical protein
LAELLEAIEGRNGWAMKGTAARYGPLESGWSGKVNEVPGGLSRAERWHAACISPAGAARYTSPFQSPGQAVSWVERVVSSQK